jgi:hypothetical protein
MAQSITLSAREDNSIENAEKVVTWARKFKDADAHIVIDYVPAADGQESIPGALNGVTVQWGHVEMLADVDDIDGDGDTTELIAQLVATDAVHVRPGGTIRRDGSGFTVDNPLINLPVTTRPKGVRP